MKKWILLVALFASGAAHATGAGPEELNCESQSIGPAPAYPIDAMRKMEFGESSVRVTTDANGAPTEVVRYSPSGSKIIDDYAMEMARKSQIACYESVDGNVFVVQNKFTLSGKEDGEEVVGLEGAIERQTRTMKEELASQPIPDHCQITKHADGRTSTDCSHDGRCHAIKYLQPVYPKPELHAGISGKNTVTVTLDPATGTIISTEVTKSAKNKNLDLSSTQSARAQVYRCFGSKPNNQLRVEYEYIAL